MKKMKHLLAALLIISASGVLGAGACDEVLEACGPCGEVEYGATTITGNAQLDGLFAAVGTLNMTAGSITGDFDAQVVAMAEGVFGLDVEGMTTAEIVGEIQLAFEAQIVSQLEGGISVQYRPPECSANVNVAVQAQAQCEASVSADCSAEVECTGPELSFECSGTCEGSCSAECSVPTCQVEITPGVANCSGECSGACAVEVSGKCEGKCEGTCDVECSAYDGQGNCAGSCSGTCEGTCEVQAEASCSGECRGSCELQGPEAEASCSADELGCKGECSGECSGSCQGDVTAPHCSGSASCDAEASADCEAQASAQASANIECTPPSLEIAYAFNAKASAEAQLEVKAKLEAFKLHMIGIIQGMVKMRALFDASYAASIGIEPPMVAIEASLTAFMNAVASGDFELTAPALLPCAVPAFEASLDIIANLPGEVAGTIDAQLELVSILNI